MKPDATNLTPWYKQRWPWLLMSVPFSSIIVGSYFAYNSIYGADPMVQDQYYAAGQSINKVIAAGKAAQRMGLVGQLNVASDKVSLVLTNPQDRPLPPVLTLQLSHPTIVSLDQSVTLVAATPGHYSGDLKRSNATRWDVTLAAPDSSWSLSGAWNKDDGPSVDLEPTDVHAAES